MFCSDDLDTTSYHQEQQQKNKEQPSAVYGGHYLYAPGLYDVYAIKYGYTPLLHEKLHVRHPDLNVLANNQSIGSGKTNSQKKQKNYARNIHVLRDIRYET